MSKLSDNKKWIIELVLTLAIAVAAGLTVRAFVFVGVEVWGASMEDTLYGGVLTDGEYKNSDKLVLLRRSAPERGDIIVFDSRAFEHYGDKVNNLVKRVIAVGGDTLTIVDASDGVQVLVNGQICDEPYLKADMQAYFDLWRYDASGITDEGYSYVEWTVDENCVFVMGDNRNNSNDSRTCGQVSLENQDYYKGKAVIRYNFSKDHRVFRFL